MPLLNDALFSKQAALASRATHYIWRRRRESNPPKSDRQSGALPRGLQRHYLEEHRRIELLFLG